MEQCNLILVPTATEKNSASIPISDIYFNKTHERFNEFDCQNAFNGLRFGKSLIT